MRHLSPSRHNSWWLDVMKGQFKSAIAEPTWPPVCWETTKEPSPGRLEVNVIFTDLHATVVALKTAALLARDLGACVRLRAAMVVPYALAVEKPLVSVPFTERLLSDLVRRLKLDTLELSVHLYLCRYRVETLLEVLRPNSLVVIGGRKRLWPTAERRMATALRFKGHRVVFIGLRSRTTLELQ